ncbi:MAG: FKBP-type peptidyl-prolyl cis-trans isomerase [Pseudomonadales bacterium]|nr:FKBP-type peptidyl-prolyl cis-trans isomerase [Pseudomonadales bacterium]
MSEDTAGGFTTINERASYGIGRQVGEQLGSQPIDGLHVSALVAGIADVLESRPSQVRDEDIRSAIDDLNQRMLRQQQQRSGAQAAAGEQFLKANAERPEVTVTASGLQYEIIEAGDGARPQADSRVKVHYHGTLTDGSVFDSSVERGEALEFPVNGVIAGWTEALQLMPAGSKWKLYVPHELAYGANGAGGMIGPYAALIFEVELLAVL